jgi:hypothetical protein
MNRRVLLAIACLTLVVSGPALFAEDIRILVPYFGGVYNEFEREYSAGGVDGTLKSDGWGLMQGLYFQWVNPELFQSNVFLYRSGDVNYARLLGLHLIGDFYFLPRDWGRAVVGGGFELISIDTDAGDEFRDDFIFDLEIPNTIYVPYVRAGHYLYFGSRDRVQLSVLPWAGLQYDIVRGEVSLTADPPGPFVQDVVIDLDDEQLSGIAGLNLGAVIFYFLELQGKYRATFNEDDYLSTVDVLANIYVSRSWALSYRFKYSESTAGSTSYHLAGVAYVF